MKTGRGVLCEHPFWINLDVGGLYQVILHPQQTFQDTYLLLSTSKKKNWEDSFEMQMMGIWGLFYFFFMFEYVGKPS